MRKSYPLFFNLQQHATTGGILCFDGLGTDLILIEGSPSYEKLMNLINSRTNGVPHDPMYLDCDGDHIRITGNDALHDALCGNSERVPKIWLLPKCIPVVSGRPATVEFGVSLDQNETIFHRVQTKHIVTQTGLASFEALERIVAQAFNRSPEMFKIFHRDITGKKCIVANDDDLDHFLHNSRGDTLQLSPELLITNTIFPLSIRESKMVGSFFRTGQAGTVLGYWDVPSEFLAWDLVGFPSGRYRAKACTASPNRAGLFVGVASLEDKNTVSIPKMYKKVFQRVDTKSTGKDYNTYKNCQLGYFWITGKPGEMFFMIPDEKHWKPINLKDMNLEYIGFA